MWACEKFSFYILGKRFKLQTDHKPLVPLLSTKQLDSLPPRILRFRLRYAYDIEYVPGKLLCVADTLSRGPTGSTSPEDWLHESDTEMFVEAVMEWALPACEGRLAIYQKQQEEDPDCSQVIQFCKTGWPTKREIPGCLKSYWEARALLTLSTTGLLLYGTRIVVPISLHDETLRKIHQGHQGITKCRLRAQMAVWWPGLSRQISDRVKDCRECAEFARPQCEPMISTTLPDYPWQKVGADLFQIKTDQYILVMDYFSRYPEVMKLSSTTSGGVINALKSILGRHGIPEALISDNGPQFNSHEFEEFTKKYDIRHETSSPHYPQSNGQAERCCPNNQEYTSEVCGPILRSSVV